MIDGENLFDHPIKSDLRTHKNIKKVSTGQGDDYTTGCLLEHYKMIAKNLSKQQAFDANWSKSNTTN